MDPGDEVSSAPFFVGVSLLPDKAGESETRSDGRTFPRPGGTVLGPFSDRRKSSYHSPNNRPAAFRRRLIGALAKSWREKAGPGRRSTVSDEPYRESCTTAKVPSILAAYGKSLVASSYSKKLSLPGERIGLLRRQPSAERWRISGAWSVQPHPRFRQRAGPDAAVISRLRESRWMRESTREKGDLL